MTESLGKIEDIYFGLGGYSNKCIGLYITLSGDDLGVNVCKEAWDAATVEYTSSRHWTEKDRLRVYADIVRTVSFLLADAKVTRIEELVGKPIKATFDELGKVIDWRIIKEAL